MTPLEAVHPTARTGGEKGVRTMSTPGPWYYIHSSPDAAEPFYAICEPDGQFEAPDLSVAVVSYSGNNYDPATLDADRAKAQANARLIASAPDLLALLREAEQVLESGLSVRQKIRECLAHIDGKVTP